MMPRWLSANSAAAFAAVSATPKGDGSRSVIDVWFNQASAPREPVTNHVLAPGLPKV
jgi:hypothetical protein